MCHLLTKHCICVVVTSVDQALFVWLCHLLTMHDMCGCGHAPVQIMALVSGFGIGTRYGNLSVFAANL